VDAAAAAVTGGFRPRARRAKVRVPSPVPTSRR
jgi:hypothetical protein